MLHYHKKCDKADELLIVYVEIFAQQNMRSQGMKL